MSTHYSLIYCVPGRLLNMSLDLHNAGNLLDVVVTDEHSTLLAHQPDSVDAGFSDHKLVASVLDVGHSKPLVRHYTFRNKDRRPCCVLCSSPSETSVHDAIG